MLDIQFKNIDIAKIQKNNLYKISTSMVVPFVEEHEKSREKVILHYKLMDGQFGIYATEYRAPVVIKKGCKTTDILACVVDENQRKLYTLIADVKSNISSFSDDLSKENALFTAVKEVRDFTEQVECEWLHKENFMMFYKHEGFEEFCEYAIVTKNFEHDKFRKAADKLEELIKNENKNISVLIQTKMRTNLRSYEGEIHRLRKFADEMLIMNKKEYALKVIILEKEKEETYSSEIQIDCK